jgi:hypothetical protein
MKKLIGFILLFWVVNIFSQSSTIKIKNYSGMYYQIKNTMPTTDGGKLILAGYDSLSLIKIDNNNQVLWAKTLFYGIGSLKIALEEKNSNYYICYQNFNTPNCQIYLMKFNNSGQLLFSKYIEYPITAWFQPHKKTDISINNADEIIISTSLDEFMTIHKIDNTGNLVFGFKINTDTINSKNYGYSSVICNDGGIILTGMSDTSTVLVKLNSSGIFQWAKSYDVSSLNDSRPKKIIKSFDGNYVISGYSIDFINATGQIPFLMKIDTLGNLMWYKEYTLGVNNYMYAQTNLAELPNNNLISYFENTNSLVETNSIGNVYTNRVLPIVCENIYIYSNQIYINTSDWNTIASNTISQSNCLTSDSTTFSTTKTITSNSVVSNTYAKIELCGALYNYPLAINNTNILIEQVCTMVGIKEINTTYNISIYPNPTTSILNISDEQNELQNSTIEIKNCFGQVVFTTPFTNQINLYNLSTGMYFLTIQLKS